jgi:hypothetical protein
MLRYAFDSQPEGPVVSLQEDSEEPEEILASIKKDLNQYEKVVSEKTEVINGIEWSFLQHTTDFGIDQVTWAARGRTISMKVSYVVTRPETAEIFEEIVRSAMLK